jgi:broad specificity phosphatase PhoE
METIFNTLPIYSTQFEFISEAEVLAEAEFQQQILQFRNEMRIWRRNNENDQNDQNDQNLGNFGDSYGQYYGNIDANVNKNDHYNNNYPNNYPNNLQNNNNSNSIAPVPLLYPNSECFVKIVNDGQGSQTFLVHGWLLTNIVYYLLNLQTSNPFLFFSRHGQSQANLSDLVGTDFGLSPAGVQYAEYLGMYMRKHLMIQREKKKLKLLAINQNLNSQHNRRDLRDLQQQQQQQQQSLQHSQHPLCEKCLHPSSPQSTSPDLTIYCSTLQRAATTAKFVYDELIFGAVRPPYPPSFQIQFSKFYSKNEELSKKLYQYYLPHYSGGNNSINGSNGNIGINTAVYRGDGPNINSCSPPPPPPRNDHNNDHDSHYPSSIYTLPTSHSPPQYSPFTLNNKIRFNVNVIKWRALAEIDAGIYDGLSYSQIKRIDPIGYQDRNVDKLNYRYERGESYKDVIDRLQKAVIFEIERHGQTKTPVNRVVKCGNSVNGGARCGYRKGNDFDQNNQIDNNSNHNPQCPHTTNHNSDRDPSKILVIAHQAVLRCCLGYFLGTDLNEIPHLDVPLNHIICLKTDQFPAKVTVVNVLSVINDDLKALEEGGEGE